MEEGPQGDNEDEDQISKEKKKLREQLKIAELKLEGILQIRPRCDEPCVRRINGLEVKVKLKSRLVQSEWKCMRKFPWTYEMQKSSHHLWQAWAGLRFYKEGSEETNW
ncbi:hypothetical protein BSKO_00311 [Bryopsis sp. KO-2023]|nr:hypothetical protein BSKO_00311 [Bryopsis sp. KO-2023]